MSVIVIASVGGVALLGGFIWMSQRQRSEPADTAQTDSPTAPSTGESTTSAKPDAPKPHKHSPSAASIDPARLLIPADPSQDWVAKRVLVLLGTKNAVPSFSVAALKLSSMTQNADVSLGELEAVIALDPGLATRCLRASSTVAQGGPPVATLQEALLRLGQRELRRIALSAGVVDAFSKAPEKVDWRAFWVHSILVARVTERLASAFQEPTGVEYLAGLLHDCGKLFIQQHFPGPFDQLIEQARRQQSGHAPAEREVLGLDHAQIGAAICACLNLHPQIVGAICFHHDPGNPRHLDDPDGDNGFLAACLAVADNVAHHVKTSLGGEVNLDCAIEELPGWQNLARFPRVRSLDLDVRAELAAAEADFKNLFAKG